MRRTRPAWFLLTLCSNIAAASAQSGEGTTPAPPSTELPTGTAPKTAEAAATPPSVPSESPPGPVSTSNDAAAPEDIAPARRAGLPCLDTPEGCKIEDFKTPTAPAFALIGVSPSQVETPRSPKELGFTLYNAYNGGALGQDVAIDVAPYWLASHPTLTYDQYVKRPVVRQLLDNLSVSAATAAVPEQSATDVGFGLRTHVFFANASDVEAGQALRDAESALMGLQGAAEIEELLVRSGCKNNSGPEPGVCPELRERLRQIAAPAEEALKEAAKAVQDALTARSGFSIGLAGAVAFRSAADRFKPNDFRKAAGWLNAGYRGKTMELASLVRFTSVDAERRLQLIDLGLRAGVFRPTWALNAEAMYRAVSGDAPTVDNSLRLAGTFEFKVIDGVFVSATYGKEADNELTSGKTFALFGLSFQAGERKLVSP